MSLFDRFFLKPGGSASRLAVVDVGADGVKVLGISLAERSKVRITGQVRIPLTEDAVSAHRGSDIGRLTEAMRTGLKALGREKGYEALAASFEDNILRGVTFHTLAERANPNEKVDVAELKNTLEKTEREARREVENKFFSVSAREHDIVLVDSQLLGFSLDGYGVADPVGLAGREFEIQVFNTYAERIVSESFEELKKNNSIKNLLALPAPYAVFRALAKTTEEPLSAVLIDIGTRETRVAVMRTGKFLGAKNFTLGGAAFERRLALHLGVDEKTAEHLLGEYVANTLSQAVARKVSGILKADLELWTRSVGLALEEFADICELFPSRIYLWGSHAALPGLLRTLETQDALLKVPFLEKRMATILLPSALGEFDALAAEHNTAEHTALYALAALLADERQNSSEIKRFVRRAVYLANQ